MADQRRLALIQPGDGAVLSQDGRYRYALWRELDQAAAGGPCETVTFVLLNPSIADAARDDPTVRRCRGFASAWGYARVEVYNVFAWRATDPAALWAAAASGEDIIGPENDAALEAGARRADLVVCAWGQRAGRWYRNRQVAALLTQARAALGPAPWLHALRLSPRTHEPVHPLYLPASLTPQPWNGYAA